MQKTTLELGETRESDIAVEIHKKDLENKFGIHFDFIVIIIIII
jgi:hypothetical protein